MDRASIRLAADHGGGVIVARTSPPPLAASQEHADPASRVRVNGLGDTGSRSRGSWGLEESPASG